MAKRVHTVEFNREAMRLASDAGDSKAQTARKLDIHPNVPKARGEKLKARNWEDEPRAAYKTEQAKELEILYIENAKL